MKQNAIISQNGNIDEILPKINNPNLLIYITTEENLLKHTEEIKKNYPNIPSIGFVAIGYEENKTCEKGLTVISFTDNIEVCTNVIEDIDKYPIKYIRRLENDLKTINAESSNTVCFDICTGYDGRLVTTINTMLSKQNIALCGGTTSYNNIAVNGEIYENACGYALIKSNKGKIKVYKENIYSPTDRRYIATKVDSSNNYIYEIDNKPAKDIYMSELNINEKEVETQTFKNPLGRLYGDEVYLISIADIQDKALHCYKQVNLMDVLTIMEINNYRDTVNETISKIKNDFTNLNGLFSVNCLFRYYLFNNENYWDEYLKNMNNLAYHTGFVGVGEHYCKQHINQTACIIAFE